MINFSILDLSLVVEGSTARQALLNSLDLARHAERAGYKRFWMAEHHNMRGIASAATAVALGHIAAGTKTIRVGAAGVMLPNHSPLIIAEQFGTLATLYPDRVDLGLGRAPGTDGKTMRALRKDIMSAANHFPQDVMELMAYFDEGNEQGVQAYPGRGLHVPIWLLGSSLYGAQLAAALGQPYIFASHFAPDLLDQALHVYRSQFQPSSQYQKPYAAASVNVFGADSRDQAALLQTSMTRQAIALFRGNPGMLKPAAVIDENEYHASELAAAAAFLKESAVGNITDIQQWFARFIERTQVDELVITSNIHDHSARLHSVAMAARALQSL